MSYQFEMVQGPTHIEFEAASSGRLLKFSGARLARAEVNKNSDRITPKGIGELAATVAGTPIDVEHEDLAICGIFTAGAPVEDPVLGTLLEVSGLVHADRYPDIAAGMQSGALSLSIEADGSSANCSVCNQTFGSSDKYCEHLKNKFKSGAVRTVEGLIALGGGVVKYPAGNGTDFKNASIKFVASQADPPAAPPTPAPVEAHMKNCPYCKTTLTAAVDKCPNPACAKGLNIEAMSEGLESALADLARVGTEANSRLNTEVAKVTTDKDAALAQVTTLTASLAEATAKLATAETARVAAEQASRRQRLGARVTDEVWEAKKATLLAMDEASFATMLELTPAPAGGKPAQPAGVRLEADQQEQSEDRTVKITGL